MSWLGFQLDLNGGVISVPEEQIVALKRQLKHAATSNQLKAHQLASIIGKIISMFLALGPVSRLMTSSMYAILNTHQYWCQ